jgi:glutamate carboxypeptidase
MDAGRNAIVALSEKVLELWKLNGTVPGLGLSPGMINGGVAVNTVPGEATCDFDLRHLLPEDRLNFEAKVREILTHSMIDDVTFAVGSFHEMPPMPKTEAIERLVGMAKQASEELGFQVEDTLTGGCSDGCIAAATGVPVLDALGPVGGAAHSDGEYTEVDTIVPRTAMLGRIVTLICEK